MCTLDPIAWYIAAIQQTLLHGNGLINLNWTARERTRIKFDDCKGRLYFIVFGDIFKSNFPKKMIFEKGKEWVVMFVKSRQANRILLAEVWWRDLLKVWQIAIILFSKWNPFIFYCMKICFPFNSWPCSISLYFHQWFVVI